VGFGLVIWVGLRQWFSCSRWARVGLCLRGECVAVGWSLGGVVPVVVMSMGGVCAGLCPGSQFGWAW
jgi:hypothetical protein